MRKVLIVHPDSHMLDLMDSLLAVRFAGDAEADMVRDEAVAVRRCRLAATVQPYQTVIANYAIAASFQTPLIETETRGLTFLESLPTLGHGDVPTILIAPTVNSRLLSRVQAIRQCALLVNEDPAKFSDDFTEYAGRALEGSLDEGQKQLKVVVGLNLAEKTWEYQVKGVGFHYDSPRGTLNVDAEALTKLIGRSRRAARQEYPDWEDALLDIGQDLGKLLIYDNPEFHQYLVDGQAKAGGPERKTICFAVEKSVHAVALEALTLPEHKDFWMVQVPIYRRLFCSGQVALERHFLFDGPRRRGETFNALVIESPAEGIVERLRDREGRNLELEPLGNVAAEARLVESELNKVTTPVERIGPDKIPAGRTFKSVLKETLTAKRWDLVHYAGHSYYDEAAGKGYLLLPGSPYVEDLDIEIFSAWLSQTRFVYLSGCQSSEAGFVFELARLQIPGVLGFRWPIGDQVALEFARQFYQSLFQKTATPCLESAFLSTRCAMRAQEPKNQIWAAAMLILQGVD